MRPVVWQNNDLIYSVTSWSTLSQVLNPFYWAKTTLTDTASFKYRFRGRVFGILSDKGTDRGILSVAVDGGTAVTVDLYNATAQANIAVPFITHSDLSDAEHEVVITVNGKNASSTNYTCRVFAVLVDDSNGEWPDNITYAPQTETVSISGTPTVRTNYANSRVGFWNVVAVAAGGVSNALNSSDLRTGRLWLDVSAATTITVQFSANNSDWADSDVSFTLSAAGISVTSVFNINGALYMRLKSSAAVTITAGYMAGG